MDASVSGTSVSLLGRLRQNQTDQTAWAAFVDRYGPKIYAWCRHWGLQEADAEDVTQDVLTILARRLATFDYDPARSFRAWLKTVTQHAWSEFVARQKRAVQGSGNGHTDTLLDSVPACEDLVGRLGGEFDQEVLEVAAARVRLRVQPHTWEAFRLTALEGLSGAEAARKLGIRVGIVFNAKSKVQKMLQEEVRKLGGTAS